MKIFKKEQFFTEFLIKPEKLVGAIYPRNEEEWGGKPAYA